MSDDEMGVTLGEVFRGLGKLEKAIETGFSQIGETFVSKELYQSEMSSLRQDVADVHLKVDSRQRDYRYWLTNIIACVGAAGSIIYALTHLIN